jgi:WG containing repeat
MKEDGKMKLQARLVCVLVLFALGLAPIVGCKSTEVSSTLTSSSGESAWSIAEPWSGPAPEAPTLFPVRQGTKWGFIDRTGQLVVGFQYDEASYFSDGMAAVRVGDEWGYIDQSGTIGIAPQFSYAYSFCDSRAQVETPAGTGYIDKTGELVIMPPLWWGAYGFSEGLSTVRLDEERYGYIDTSGELVIRLAARAIGDDFSEGLAAVRDEHGGYGYIDRSGQFVIEPQFWYATEFSNGLAVVEYADREYELIDKTGRVVQKLEYDEVMGLKEGRAAVQVYEGEWPSWPPSERWWGYMDESGELVIPTQFENAWDFGGGLARVEDQNGKMAYIDLEGNYVWREE